ncbi:MAG: STAS domain-containing protein [Chloroflexota bacterium]
MDMTHRTHNGVDILELSGRFDAYEVPEVTRWMDDNPNAKNMVVNLQGVGFIDSSGLATLVKGLKRCRRNGGDMYLCNLQQAVLIIFELTRLDKAFNIVADETAALNTLKAE